MRKKHVTLLAVVVGLGLAAIAVWPWSPSKQTPPGALKKATIAHGVTPNSALFHIAHPEGDVVEKGLAAADPTAVSVIR